MINFNLYFQPANAAAQNDWRADGHRWINSGVKKLPSTTPTYKKSYFTIVNSDDTSQKFKREAYWRISDQVCQYSKAKYI